MRVEQGKLEIFASKVGKKFGKSLQKLKVCRDYF